MKAAEVLITGTGEAGYKVAVASRDAGYGRGVVLIGEEPDLPYQRPPLSKAFQSGDCEAEQLTFQTEAFYAGRDIELMLGVRILHIDRARRQVTTGDGRCMEYEHLVPATGARNRLLPGWDSATTGLLSLRTLHEARGLREALNRSKQAVIVGAGFLGLEFAAVAAKRGVSVRVIEASSNLMSRAVTSPA